MTMFFNPTASGRRTCFDGYAAAAAGEKTDQWSCLLGDIHSYSTFKKMANHDDEFRIGTDHDRSDSRTCNKDGGGDERGWLRLGVGSDHDHRLDPEIDDQTTMIAGPPALIPLHLTQSSCSTSGGSESHSASGSRLIIPDHRQYINQAAAPINSGTSGRGRGRAGRGELSFLLHQNMIASSSGSAGFPADHHPRQEIFNSTWPPGGFRHSMINPAYNNNSNTAPVSSSSRLLTPFPASFQLFPALDMMSSSSSISASQDFRIVQPPPPPLARPSPGLWLILQPSHNPEKQGAVLPELAKPYIRIKDGRMTVGLVIKYLVIKLNLDNENQIEIRCKGQRLEADMMLQHVRDTLWKNNNSFLTRDNFITLLPNSSPTHHMIMLLHYAPI